MFCHFEPCVKQGWDIFPKILPFIQPIEVYVKEKYHILCKKKLGGEERGERQRSEVRGRMTERRMRISESERGKTKSDYGQQMTEGRKNLAVGKRNAELKMTNDQEGTGGEKAP